MSMLDKLDLPTLVSMANGNRAAIEKSGFESVKDLVSRNDLVFGVWQDVREPGGVGTTIVKGKSRLVAIIEKQSAENLSFTAIPCTSYEQAEALKRVQGDGAPH